MGRKTDDSEVLLKKGGRRHSRVVPGGIRRQYVAMSTDAPGPGLALRALVVDDETPLAEVVASYLRRELFEVHLAHDGHRALDLAREVDPHVVVLDIGLPGVDGVEVCRQLRLFSDAYVVMLTARDTEMDTIVGLVGRSRRLRHQAVQPPRAGGPRARDDASTSPSISWAG